MPPSTSVVFGGAKPNPSHQPLKELLIKHGVPQENVQKRLDEIHSKLSHAAVQQALQAKNPWAHLKKAAQDVDLRLVKKEELQHHIEQRQFQGVGKNQKAPAKQWHLPKAGDLQIMPGWIAHADGTPADQLHMQGINAASTGLAFVDSAAAEPWLERRGKHPHPLLLLLTGPPASSHSLPEAQVPAIFLPTQEKILLTCGFLQLGPADKALKLKDTTKVDLNLQATQCVKLVWHRETKWPGQLDHGLQRASQDPHRPHGMGAHLPPNRMHMPEMAPRHRRILPTAQCMGPPMAHPTTRALRPGQSSHVPSHVQNPGRRDARPPCKHRPCWVLRRTPCCGRTIPRCPLYTVIWTPGHTLQELHTKRAADDRILALTRHQQRYGVRCHKQKGKELWAILRPGQQWIDPSHQELYQVGPLPRGVSKDILQSIATSLKWQARPHQPAYTTKEGVHWTFLAAQAPPQEHVEVEGALVSILHQEKPARPVEALPRLVAPKTTQAFLQGQIPPHAEDPLQLKDPWAQARPIVPTPIATALTRLPALAPTPDVQALEARLTKMEQAQADDAQQLQAVKQDVGQLRARVDNGFATVETHLTQQLAHLQQAMTSSVSEQIATQLQHFESLLKRPRTDS